jgi:hypothetical protein
VPIPILGAALPNEDRIAGAGLVTLDLATDPRR